MNWWPIISTHVAQCWLTREDEHAVERTIWSSGLSWSRASRTARSASCAEFTQRRLLIITSRSRTSLTGAPYVVQLRLCASFRARPSQLQTMTHYLASATRPPACHGSSIGPEIVRQCFTRSRCQGFPGTGACEYCCSIAQHSSTPLQTPPQTSRTVHEYGCQHAWRRRGDISLETPFMVL